MLPPFITPTWGQSLEMLAAAAKDNNSSSQPKASVEWRDDGTSVLCVTLDSLTSSSSSSSFIILLDYKPTFLTIDFSCAVCVCRFCCPPCFFPDVSLCRGCWCCRACWYCRPVAVVVADPINPTSFTNHHTGPWKEIRLPR